MVRARFCVIVACLLACVLLPGCGRKVYERADLEKKVKGLTDDQLRRALGSPDDYSQGAGGSGHYTYKDLVRTKDGSDVEGVTITTENGRVTYLTYPSDPPVMNVQPKLDVKFR